MAEELLRADRELLGKANTPSQKEKDAEGGTETAAASEAVPLAKSPWPFPAAPSYAEKESQQEQPEDDTTAQGRIPRWKGSIRVPSWPKEGWRNSGWGRSFQEEPELSKLEILIHFGREISEEVVKLAFRRKNSNHASTVSQWEGGWPS